MEIDEVRDLMGEYSARLGIPEPQVCEGRVAPRNPTGLEPRRRRRRMELVVGQRFAELERPDQEALLACAVAACALVPAVRRRTSVYGIVLAVSLIAADIALGIEMPILLWLPCYLVLYFGGYYFGVIFFLRSLCYRVDHMVAYFFGWAMLDALLECERENPDTRWLVRLVSPSRERRMARLDRLRATAG